MLIEGWGFFDALYMTVTTITTVGFKEVRALSGRAGFSRWSSSCAGSGSCSMDLATIVEYAIKAQLSGVFKRRAVKKQVDKLENHYIICGYGRVGESVARQFAAQRVDFVIVDNDPASLARAEATAIWWSKATPPVTRLWRRRESRRQKGW